MPKRAEEWGPLDTKRAVHSGRQPKNEWYAVGGVSGLLLQITPGQAKSWILRTMIGGVRRSIGLGAYPEISLAQARDKAREAKGKIGEGVDPIEERKAAKAALAAARKRNILFDEAADKWILAKLKNRPEKSQKAVRATLAKYAFPEIGRMNVQDITNQDVTRALAPIWGSKPDTATKLRSYVESILTWATLVGHRTGDNPARWGGNLKELLTTPSATEKRRGGHFPAIPVDRLPDFWTDLCDRDGMGARALRFAALCAARSGEVRGAVWEEIDLVQNLWTVPAERMKAGMEHRVPLSSPAVALLNSLPRIKGVPDIFPTVVGENILPTTVVEIPASEKGISPSTVGSNRKAENGAGARSGAHLSPEQDIPVLDDEEDVEPQSSIRTRVSASDRLRFLRSLQRKARLNKNGIVASSTSSPTRTRLP